MRRILFAFLIFFFAFTSGGFSQACLSNYQFRVPVRITNPNGVLYNFQVKVIVNTQDLLSSDKLRLDGGDIRFTSENGTILSYWFDPSTLNTTTTEFWVKVDELEAVADTIYLFYGNPSAAFMSSGDATFEFFDEFDGTAIDSYKWTRCGDISNVSLSAGTIYFNDSNTKPDGIVYSNITFMNNVIVEADVQNAANGKAILGLVDNSKQGYATTMENTGSIVMKMSKVSNDAGGCQFLDDVFPPTGTPAITGVWSFKWPAAASQVINCSGVELNYSDASYSGAFGNQKKVILGTHLNDASSAGSLSVDWLRVRKLAVDPVATPGSEEEFPVSPNASNDGPFCGGDTIHFNSVLFAGADYIWYNPSNIQFANVYNPTLVSTPAMSGEYKLEVSVPGCPAVVSYTIVDVSQTSVAGTTSGNAIVCSNSNSGNVSVTGISGDVIRWEMANAATGPWYTISGNNDTISYSNLLQNTYFRPVVKTSACPEAIGSAAMITVNNTTVGGFILGSTAVCSGTNGGTLNLVYSTGAINRWWRSTNGTDWTEIINNNTNYSFTNLTQTTYFKAEVQNGSSCPVMFSDSAIVTVNPLPEPSFTATTVCEGQPTVFTNTSTIASGSINSYQWNFGNSNSSISASPAYTYPLPGLYLVELTAVSASGCTASASMLDTINPLPVVNFTAPPGCLGNPTVFQALVTVPGGTVSSYFWNHDNGTSSTSGTHSYTYPDAGLYDVVLTVTTNKGCVDSLSKQIEVSSPVNVGYLADSVCFGEYITFINTSSSGLPVTITYTWDFGNGATSNLTSPNYIYPEPGTYAVILQAQTSGSSSSCISMHQDTVVVYEIPSPDFSFENVCLSDSASFLNSTFYNGLPTDLSYNWAFGDAVSNSGVNPSHLYNTPGNFNVTLTANTTNGCSADKTKLISIYPMPVANFSADDVCDENNVNFISTSTVSTGTLTYLWNFGDEGTSPVQNPLHLYSGEGTYDVTLITTTNNNCTDTIMKAVTVHPLPVVDFLNSPVCDGLPSSFSQNVTISSGSIVSYYWDFGDGSSAGSSVAEHQYSVPGTYNVKLRATSDFGCIHDTTKSVIVTPVPVAGFSAENACLNTPNIFTNSSSILGDSPLTYAWSFGEGGTSSLTSPGYIYDSPGIYQVWLVTSSGPGCTDSIMLTAQVYELPEVNAGRDTTISKGDEVMLNGYAPSGIYYAWDPFSTLTSSSIPNPVARPDETTTYVLAMTDVFGCQNTDSITITVENDFKLLIYNVITPDENGQNDYWEIENIEFYPDAKVQIFNRWGEMVYEKTGYQNDWQGTYENDQLPDGSYYYVISFPDTDFNYRGSITLLRNK